MKKAIYSFLVLLLVCSLESNAQSGNPQTYVDSVCPCTGPVGSVWQNHGQYMKCVTDAVNDLKKRKLISPNQGGQIISAAAQSNCGKAGDELEDPEDSPGILTMTGANPNGFNPRTVKLVLNLANAQFSLKPEEHFIELNGNKVNPSDLLITSSAISFTLVLNNGFNRVDFYGLDANRFMTEDHYTLWAGSNTLPVRVIDQNNLPVSNALVKVTLSDDTAIVAEGLASNGMITFQNIPARTLIASATAPGNQYGTGAGIGNGSMITIKLLPFKTPSLIDNNDFSLGTDGWDVSNAGVIVLHDETQGNVANPSTATPNYDLRVETGAIGERTASRTFTTKPGTKSVIVRYRFVTTEVPGGFFGSQFNDYFSVSIRSKNGALLSSAKNSMNGLGLGAFVYSTGATAWKDLPLTLTQSPEDIHVDIVVANVGDGLFDSWVEIDYVDEDELAITKLSLIDPDKANSLKYLSIDNHTYFGGKVPVYGTITVEGKEEDKLTSLNIEVVDNSGNVINTASLAAGAQAALFQAFGTDEKVEITSTQLLFELPSMNPMGADGNVLVRLKAVAESGKDAPKDFKLIPNLRLFTGSNRFGFTRDPEKGGDAWGLPSTIDYAYSLPSGWLINDISNMNANVFPGHKSHREGIDIDVTFTGYASRNASVAQTLITFLNGPLGSRVEKIFVAYTQSTGDVFWNAIKDVTLANDKKASEVILGDGTHDEHFHIRLNASSGTANQFIQNADVVNMAPRMEPVTERQTPTTNLTVYPNPASHRLNISLNSINDKDGAVRLNDIRQIKVRDKSGNVLITSNYAPGTRSLTLYLQGLSPDVYMLEASDGIHKASMIVRIVK